VLRFKSLGSGSSGNATVIDSGGPRPVRVLVDCGLGIRVLTQRLATAGLEPQDLDAIFITHEHGDHVGCAPALAARHGIALWMSEGTWLGCGAPELGEVLHLTGHGESIDLGALELRPFAVPHDAREPLQLVCRHADGKLGILTDLGHVPPDVQLSLQGCQALLLECNHDAQMLSDSPYPAFLKRRVGGELGHLSNAQAAELASALGPGLRQVVAAHLSRQNNRPDLALAALQAALGEPVGLCVADPVVGTDWLTG